MDDSMDDLGTRWSGFGDELLETEGRWIGNAIPFFEDLKGTDDDTGGCRSNVEDETDE